MAMRNGKLIECMGNSRRRPLGQNLLLCALLLLLQAWTPVLSAKTADEHRAFTIDRVRGAVMHELALKSGDSVKSEATVETDRPDYPPGTQVNVIGSGWLPGE